MGNWNCAYCRITANQSLVCACVFSTHSLTLFAFWWIWIFACRSQCIWSNNGTVLHHWKFNNVYLHENKIYIRSSIWRERKKKNNSERNFYILLYCCVMWWYRSETHMVIYRLANGLLYRDKFLTLNERNYLYRYPAGSIARTARIIVRMRRQTIYSSCHTQTHSIHTPNRHSQPKSERNMSVTIIPSLNCVCSDLNCEENDI